MTTYLFDWGDTLMVDFPDIDGKMCDWANVEAVTGAEEVLAQLSKDAPIYLATGAVDSSEQDIKRAFQRVGLNQYITGVFCKENLGVTKESPDFFRVILQQLNIPASQVIMVGDSYAKDIKPALSLGITPVWFAPDNNQPPSQEVRTIRCLSELCTAT